MKRRTLKFMVCAAMMSLTLSVTACGGSDDGDDTFDIDVEEMEDEEEDEIEDEEEDEIEDEEEDEIEDEEEDEAEDEEEDEIEDEEEDEVEDEEEDEIEDEEEDETEDEADEAEDGSFETLEEAFAMPEVKAAMDEQLSAMNMDGMEISYEVTGNDFIVTYKVLGTTIDDPADFAAQMEPVMDQLEVLFSAVAEMFDEALEEEGATTVVVRFLDASDTLLVERSYNAE